MKSPFMIYADFESIFVPESNGKQNLDEPYTNKYQTHVGCSFGYKLVFNVEDQFNKLYLIQDTVHKFITNMVEESKYCSRVIKRPFNKEFVMVKKKIKILRALQNVGFTIVLLKMMLK